MSKKTVYVEDVFEALKELTAKEESYVDPFASVFKMIEDLPPACCSDCIANGGDFECDRVNCHKGAQPSIKMSDSWRDELITKGAALDALTEVESHYEFEDGHDHLMRWAKTKIFVLPPEQPEIIRCKDCKYIEEHHYEEDGEPPYIKYTCAYKAGLAKGYQVHEYDFCSRAERKEDE